MHWEFYKFLLYCIFEIEYTFATYSIFQFVQTTFQVLNNYVWLCLLYWGEPVKSFWKKAGSGNIENIGLEITL